MINKNNFSEGYSVDYRSSQTDDKYIQNKSAKTVVANSPKIRKVQKKVNVEKTKEKGKPFKIVKDQTSEKESKNLDVYTKVHSPRKVLIYKTLYACLVILLAFIGVTIFSSSLGRTTPSCDTVSHSCNQYNKILAPVVMHDPAPFDRPENANLQMVISSCIWYAITKNGTQKYNTFDERGFSLIPVSDVVDASHELFGENYKLNTDEALFGPFYSLYSGDNNFHVSAISNQNSCIPYVDGVNESEEFIILNVGYVTRDDKFLRSDSEKASEPNPIKYMKYKLKKNPNNSFFIYAVENP